MNILTLNILLAMVWAALVGSFSLANLSIGFVLGYFTLFLIRGALGSTNYFFKGGQLARFALYFIWELIIANLRVARDVLRPGPLRMKPRVIAVPLESRDPISITTLANVLSLTPGTLSLDVSNDREVLFVHSINAPDPDAARLEIKNGFEKLVLDLLEGQARPAPAEKERDE